jgi:hypothetical protein
MSETITLHALDLSGETLTLFLRQSDGSLLNTGGDAGTEAGATGVFTFTLGESRTGLGPLAVRVCAGAETGDNLLYDGWLVESTTLIDAVQAVELDSATSQKIDDILTDTGTTLPGLIGDIEGGGGGGLTGPYTRTIAVTDADTDEPIEGAKVRLYRTGETGSVPTDEEGIASFTVEAATWSYGVTASGYTGVSGTVVVSANGNTPVQMEAVSITPPSNPDLSAIVVLCLDAAGQPEPDVDVDIRIVTVPSGSRNIAYKGAKQTATSDDDGIARFEVVQGSVCEWKRGRADVWSRVTIDSDSVTNVTSVIGSP